MTHTFIESERRFRYITPEEETNTPFLNWKNDENGAGIASFITIPRIAVKRLRKSSDQPYSFNDCQSR
jgi:hypothetical protein